MRVDDAVEELGASAELVSFRWIQIAIGCFHIVLPRETAGYLAEESFVPTPSGRGLAPRSLFAIWAGLFIWILSLRGVLRSTPSVRGTPYTR